VHPASILVINDKLKGLASEITDTYRRRTSQHAGQFKANEASYPFIGFLRLYRSGKSSFLQFTTSCADHLRVLIADEFFAVGGHLLFVEYEQNAHRLLLIVKIQQSQGQLFNAGMTEVLDAIYLNVNDLQVAGRVNLTAWDAAAHNCVTFVQKRDQGHPSDYFVRLLGVEVSQDPRVESGKLVDVVNAYCKEKVPDSDAALAVKHRAFDFAAACAKERRPVDLTALANAVIPDNPSQFTSFLNDQPNPPTDGFFVSKAALRSLVGYEFRSSELTVKMTSEFFRDHKVRVNAKNQLIIDNIPDGLRDKLVE
jgi:nucleoid-associated protein